MDTKRDWKKMSGEAEDSFDKLDLLMKCERVWKDARGSVDKRSSDHVHVGFRHEEAYVAIVYHLRKILDDMEGAWDSGAVAFRLKRASQIADELERL